MIKCEAVYKPIKKGEAKFEGFRCTIGEQTFDPIPINYLRISELPKLQSLLEAAFKLGREQGSREGFREGYWGDGACFNADH